MEDNASTQSKVRLAVASGWNRSSRRFGPRAAASRAAGF